MLSTQLDSLNLGLARLDSIDDGPDRRPGLDVDLQHAALAAQAAHDRRALEPADRTEPEQHDRRGDERSREVAGAARHPDSATTQSPAAVVTPRTESPWRMITPAPRNPIPATIWAAIRVGGNVTDPSNVKSPQA